MHGMVYIGVLVFTFVCCCTANSLRRPTPKPMKICDLENICGEHGDCHAVRRGGRDVAICTCHPGFTGKCCESFIPQRCKLYSDSDGSEEEEQMTMNENDSEEENDEKMMNTLRNESEKGMVTCKENFWCVADSFYCNLFRCKTAEGWCVPVAPEKVVPECKHHAHLFE